MNQFCIKTNVFLYLGHTHRRRNMTEAKRVPSLGKDDRNFRSHYYEKVGFRGVDERKTLELLWNEDPLSIDKFCNFAQRCTIPSCDRIQVWKVILGVSPRFANNKERNWKWKVQPYEDNMRFMTSAGKIDEARPKAQNHTILWLVFNGRLNFDFKPQLSEFWPMNFSAISESMLSICDDHDASVIESFYLAKGLTDVLHKFPDDVINETIQCYHRMLANNSNTNKLYGHLEKIGLNEEIPLKSWICRGFAGVLNTSALEKIWDKVIGGSLKILVFVALALIESSKMALQGCQTSQEAIRCLVSVLFLFLSTFKK
jgi:hypothetical protein